MAIHFSPDEMAARKRRLTDALAEARLDGALLFAQESDYWLTGYDTFGFCFFQCLYVGADGRVALLTRSADLRQAERTSNIADIRIWKDSGRRRPDARPQRHARRPRRRTPARRRVRHAGAHPFPRPQARGGALRPRARRHLRTRPAPARDANRPPSWPTFARRRGSPISPTARRSRRRAPAPTRAKSSPPCITRCSRPAAIIPATSSSSARAATRLLCRYKSGRRRARRRRPDHAGVRRRQPSLPRRDHAHACGRPPEAAARELSRRRPRGRSTPAPPR